MLAAVNPCGFALLPAYLSLFVLDRGTPPRGVALRRAARATAALTLGFAAVFLAFGLAVAPVASSVQGYLPGFTVVLGTLLAAAGLWVAAGRKLPAISIRRNRAAGRPVTASWMSMTGFGASYAIASLGCTVAPFLAVVVAAFRAGSLVSGVVLFLAYALGMGLVVAAAAFATALARGGLVTRVRGMGGALPRIGGLVLALAGAYVAWYGLWELRVLHGGAGADPLITAAGSIQHWLAAQVTTVGAWGFGLVVALPVLAAFGLNRLRQRSGHRAALARPEPTGPEPVDERA